MGAQFEEKLFRYSVSRCWSVERNDAYTARIRRWEVREIDTRSRLSGVEAESGVEKV
jgi:hypothetical protein